MAETGRGVALIAALATLAYTALYLVAVGDLNVHADAGSPALRIMNDPWSLMLERRVALQFEAVAILRLPYLVWLVSPLNLAIGVILGGLVGLNAALGTLAFRRRTCAVGGATASAALVPALLSGGACCGPLALITLGIPVTATLLSLFHWLVPLTAALLVASALLLARGVSATRATPR